MSERFIIEQQISARKSADTYLAYDTKADRKTRLRRIHSPMTAEQLESVSEAFRVTQRQLTLVKSDIITHILESGIDEHGAWLSLPYYEAQQLLSAHTLPITLPEFHNLATQLLAGLEAIHEQNLVHGALNMDSIDVLVSEANDGRIRYRIHDLGMRRLLVLVQNPAALASLPSDPATLAPELFKSQNAEPSSDLYMAGHLLYYLVAGGHPFVGLDVEAAFAKHIAHDIEPAHTINPNIPAEVSSWLDGLTQPELNDRFQTASEAIASLPHIAPDIKKQPTTLVSNSTGKLTTTHVTRAEKKAIARKLPSYIYVIAGLSLATLIGFFFILRSDGEPRVSASQSESENVAAPSAKEVSIAEMKPIASGTISGASMKVSNANFQIGSTTRGATPWGKGKSGEATGPDLGASYRAFVVFKIANIIDADPGDSFVNVASLRDLTLELSVNRKNTASFTPMIYAPKVVEKQKPANFRAVAQQLENGILPVENEKKYTFTLMNVDLSSALYDQYFIFIFTASKPPANGEMLDFARTTLSLKVTK